MCMYTHAPLKTKGGSGLDAGKSIAMVSKTGLPLEEFDWMRDSHQPLTMPHVVCVPTTAGTGAEMDSASMFTDTERGVKRCVAHPSCEITVELLHSKPCGKRWPEKCMHAGER